MVHRDFYEELEEFLIIFLSTIQKFY